MGGYDPVRYPVLTIDLGKLEHNLREIMARCAALEIQVAGVVKGFTAWPKIARVYERCGCTYLASSRIGQLRRLRDAGIQTPLMLLRVPMLSELEAVAEIADISLQSEPEALRRLNAAAARVFAEREDRKSNRAEAAESVSPERIVPEKIVSEKIMRGKPDKKIMRGKLSGNIVSAKLTPNGSGDNAARRHKVILMADLGDLREGFWNRQELIDTAAEIERDLPHLELAGIGTNLTCFGSVKATPEKMLELLAITAQVEAAIGRKLTYVCGGASSSLHMVLDGTMPDGVNLLRLGESVLLGAFSGCEMDFTYKDVFTLKAEVVEVKDKPSYPIGELAEDAFGRIRRYEDRGIRRRALAAIGLVDYGNYTDIRPRMKGVKVIGASSDHTILDVEAVKDRIHVGDVLEFDISYASMVYLTNTESVRREYRQADD